MNLLLCVALAVGAPGVKNPPKKAAPTILGSWQLEGFAVGGAPVPRPKGDDSVITFRPDGTFGAERNGKPESDGEGTYQLDEKKTPAELDLIPPKDKTMLAIFRIDGDTLTLCMGETRPTSFESTAGGMAVVMTFKRVPKE
jgi:uncharacterized protein (TIGR03067 family)